jgi:membrane-associated phospholipid phosphatase
MEHLNKTVVARIAVVQRHSSVSEDLRRVRTIPCVIGLIVLLVTSAGVSAQTLPDKSPTPQPQASPTPTLEKQFLKNILRDQRAVWTAPLHLRRADTSLLLPLGLSTAVLLATDRHTAGALGENRGRLNVSRDIAYLGSGYGAGGIAAAFYVFGRTKHNARARETGILGAEALIDSGIVAFALKNATQRPRPRIDNASGEFFDGGRSFPSGHAIASWSLATVVANEYKDRPFVRWGAYGLAAAVSVSRYTGRNHFLSDALVGSAIGYAIGRYVYRAHHDPAIEISGGESRLRERSKRWPTIAPSYNRRAHDYGLTLAWSF